MRKVPDVTVYYWDFEAEELVESPDQPFIFPGGEPHINESGELDYEEHKDFYILIHGGSFEAVGTALVVNDFLDRKGAYGISLLAPYFPGARMDRGEPFTVNIYADIINDAGFDTVVVVDPHSAVTENLVQRIYVIHPTELIPHDLFHYRGLAGLPAPTFSIIAPDKGAVGRARAAANRFNVPLVVADKTRDPEKNYAVSTYSVPEIKTDYAVVIDDICDGGGTFLALAKATGLEPHRLRLWTTHGIYSKGTDVLDQAFSYIASTDSIRHTESIHQTVPLLPVFNRYIAQGEF